MKRPSLPRPIGAAWSALLWLAFPIAPLLVENAYYQLCTLEFFESHRFGPDPHDWNAAQWAAMLGPLCGFGFLAGCTWKIGDEPGRRGWRSWKSKRAVWVGLGPWLGFLSLAAVALALYAGSRVLDKLGLMPGGSAPVGPMPEPVNKVMEVIVLTWLVLGWLIVAVAALRRANRMGRFRAALGMGLGFAIVFVGSLFGGFWIVTTAWGAYYFDPTIVP